MCYNEIMKKVFTKIDQWANRKEKMSRKQRVYQRYINISAFIFLLGLGLLVYSIIDKILWLLITCGIILLVSYISFVVFQSLEGDEFKRITNKSVEYYKRETFQRIYFEFLAVCLCIAFAILFVVLSQIQIDISSIYSISIGIFSLVPIIYIFILPEIKKNTTNLQKDLKQTLYQIKKNNKSPNFISLKTKQGEIFRLIILMNQASIQLIISIFIFAVSIIAFFFSKYNTMIVQGFPIVSILYCLYEVFILIALSYNFYKYNKKEVEREMKCQIQIAEKQQLKKHNEEILKIYTEEGKVCGKESRKNCYKPKCKNYYKTAYIIIKNKKAKYFVYQQILDYEKAQYYWQATYNCDELSKENIRTSLLKKLKSDFDLTLNRNDFKLIKKNTMTDKHQFIEIYLVETDLNNANIDYNIDLYVTAKFVSFKHFIKILNSSKVLPENLVEDIRIELANQNKST